MFFRRSLSLCLNIVKHLKSKPVVKPRKRVFARFYSSEEICKKFVLPKKYGKGEKSIWVEFAEVAAATNPVNLGQGFPDFPPPKHITEGLSKVACSKNHLIHQYTRGYGHPRLVKALSKLYSELICRDIDPMSEFLITYGAYEALFSVIYGHAQEGDEVILIEPFFDCYEPMVKGCGATPRCIPLRYKGKKDAKVLCSEDFELDKQELECLFNEKTKMILVNTPNNPFGKVFTRDELCVIADLCKKWNVLCVSDEVYEWMVYPPAKHIRMATLPGMWERTITIGSAGKAMSVTGWKTGWAYGPANLMHNLTIAHSFCVYICITPIQEALAMAFEKETKNMHDCPEECFFLTLPKILEKKRDYVVEMFANAGMKPVNPQGGYFILADWTPYESKVDLSGEKDKWKDFKMAKWMAKNIGLMGIPATAFFSEKDKPLIEKYLRYCFIKEDKKLKDTEKLLKKMKKKYLK